MPARTVRVLYWIVTLLFVVPQLWSATQMLTEAGRDAFEQAYDDLAVSALQFLVQTGGEKLVADFARQRIAALEERYRPAVEAARPGERAQALARVLTSDGYAASAQSSPVAPGEQLCQHHCPVAHVAEQFPQLCEAETEAFARLLGTHVQRLATIAHGDGVCTTHIPRGPGSAGRTVSPTRPLNMTDIDAERIS